MLLNKVTLGYNIHEAAYMKTHRLHWATGLRRLHRATKDYMGLQMATQYMELNKVTEGYKVHSYKG